MATLLFIDTNIWLDFYRSNNDAGLSLLKRVKELSKFILVTDQIEMEFEKNRQGVIWQAAKNLNPPQDISIPAFLTSDEAKDLKKSLEASQQLIKKIKKRLPHILKDPEANDPVYQICREVFSRKEEGLSYGQDHADWKEVQDAALKRFQLGYPPRKSDDTSMGDAVNWEWIIRCANLTKSNIAIVSRDDDYGAIQESTVTLNDHLRREFSNRVNKKQTIFLFTKLTEALKQLHVPVTQKEVREENRLIENSLASGPTTDEESLFWASYLSHANALVNSPMLKMAQDAAQKHADLETSLKQATAMLNSPALRMLQKTLREQDSLKAGIKHISKKGEEGPV